jgi:hypothetical protein
MQIVNHASVAAVVNSTNSFSKEFMAVPENRELVKKLRAEKKERLMSLSPSQIGTLIEARGLVLVGETVRTLKNGSEVVTLKLKAHASEKSKLEAQIAKLQAKLATV